MFSILHIISFITWNLNMSLQEKGSFATGTKLSQKVKNRHKNAFVIALRRLSRRYKVGRLQKLGDGKIPSQLLFATNLWQFLWRYKKPAIFVNLLSRSICDGLRRYIYFSCVNICRHKYVTSFVPTASICDNVFSLQQTCALFATARNSLHQKYSTALQHCFLVQLIFETC